MPDGIEVAIALLDPQTAPATEQPFVLNFDYADPALWRGSMWLTRARGEQP
jgi:hypothetical protein